MKKNELKNLIKKDLERVDGRSRRSKRYRAMLEDMEELTELLSDTEDIDIENLLSVAPGLITSKKQVKTVYDQEVYHDVFCCGLANMKKTVFYQKIKNGASSLREAVYGGNFLIYDEDIKDHYLTKSNTIKNCNFLELQYQRLITAANRLFKILKMNYPERFKA